MALSASDVVQLRAALQESVVKCSERCLYQSAKWAAELLTALPEPINTEGVQAPAPTFFLPNTDPNEAALEAREANKYLLAKALFDCREYDRCAAVFLPDNLLNNVMNAEAQARENAMAESAAPRDKAKIKLKGGRALMRRNAAAMSENKTFDGISLPNLSQRSLFLALYAKFMAGEKRKTEDTEMVMGPQDLGTVVNKQAAIVGRLLSAWFEERAGADDEVHGSQGWLEYLHGMVLARQKDDNRALDYLIRSVHIFPMNWSCWLEITSLVSRVEELNRITQHLPHNIVSFMFHVHTSLELYQQNAQLAGSVEQLLQIFPTSSFLLSCSALLSYHAKDLITAEQAFGKLLALHPHRLDSLDHYSNILYVMNLRSKLAFLAHLCSAVDKFRPESCVVIGNYYSLLSMHEKAVQYFRRALTLDRSCLSAWTLMGHEYVELKNTHAAIESYRRAVDVNRRDYRAWYGLGQTYEMLEMHTYSLWYYKKAAGLRPWDGKMWQAVGSCLQRMGRNVDGIKAFKRALLAEAFYDGGSLSFENPLAPGVRSAIMSSQMDPEILLQIALMYEHLEEKADAKAYMELCVAQEDGNMAGVDSGKAGEDADDDANQARGDGTEGTGVTMATSAARKWLARNALEEGDYKTASRLANELCQDGVEIEDAKALLREVKARMDALGGR